MPSKTISINRALVLTLWTAVVAERLGFDEDEALSLGKSVAGLNAQSKGRRLGIFKPHEGQPKNAREKKQGEEFWIELCGRPVTAENTEDGIWAVRDAKPSSQRVCGATWKASLARTWRLFARPCSGSPTVSSQ